MDKKENFTMVREEYICVNGKMQVISTKMVQAEIPKDIHAVKMLAENADIKPASKEDIKVAKQHLTEALRENDK